MVGKEDTEKVDSTTVRLWKWNGGSDTHPKKLTEAWEGWVTVEIDGWNSDLALVRYPELLEWVEKRDAEDGGAWESNYLPEEIERGDHPDKHQFYVHRDHFLAFWEVLYSHSHIPPTDSDIAELEKWLQQK